MDKRVKKLLVNKIYKSLILKTKNFRKFVFNSNINLVESGLEIENYSKKPLK